MWRWLRLAGAILRLTRLVTSDTAPEWLVIGRLRDWADDHESAYAEALVSLRDRLTDEPDKDNIERLLGEYYENSPVTWQARLVSGVDCPFCVGFWITLAAFTVDTLLPSKGVIRRVWDTLTIALATNYVTGHLSSRLDG